MLPSLTSDLVLVGAAEESGSETKTSGEKPSAEMKTINLNQRSTKRHNDHEEQKSEEQNFDYLWLTVMHLDIYTVFFTFKQLYPSMKKKVHNYEPNLNITQVFDETCKSATRGQYIPKV